MDKTYEVDVEREVIQRATITVQAPSEEEAEDLVSRMEDVIDWEDDPSEPLICEVRDCMDE